MIYRREFLAASAGLLAHSLTRAADPPPLFSFALVTDTHLGKAGADYVKRMATAIEEINASTAEFTVFCGDLVDNGQEEKNQKLYGTWLELAKTLKKPYTAVPGNHDPAAQFTKHIQKQTESILEHKDYRILAFADAEPNPGHMGVVTPDQFTWLSDRLKEAGKKQQKVILCAHVIHHANQAPDIGWYIKDKAMRVSMGKLFTEHKQIVAFFSGHAHCGMRGWSDTAHGIHEVILPCVSYNNNRKLEKAPGFAVEEFRPAWVRVDIFDKRMVLNYKPVGAAIAASKELTLPV